MELLYKLIVLPPPVQIENVIAQNIYKAKSYFSQAKYELYILNRSYILNCSFYNYAKFVVFLQYLII